MWRFIPGLLAGAFLFFLPGLRADAMRPLAIETLTAKAQLVLHGKVIGTTVQRDAEGRIFTLVDLQVDEVWKGRLTTNHVNIVHGGGVLGDERLAVSGQVDYQLGEEVVAFLVLNQHGEGVSIGLSQGKFHVWLDPITGEKLARNRFHGLRPTAKPPSTASPPAVVRERVTLAELKQMVAGGPK